MKIFPTTELKFKLIYYQDETLDRLRRRTEKSENSVERHVAFQCEKMSALKIILILVILITFTSCDCLQNVTGTVIDAQTDEPIQGAHVQKENKDHDEVHTDEKGYFKIESISGGLFGCPPMTVMVSKDGYETQIIKIDNAKHETIKLKRIAE